MRRFEDLVIVERAGSIAGGYCAKLFADHGAQVFVIGEGELNTAEAIYLNEAKIQIEGALSGSSNATASGELVERADVLIESSAARSLEPMTLEGDHIVHVQLSPFGSWGPYSRWQSSDMVDYALGGHLYLYGHPDREPILGPPNQPRYAAGLFGFVGAMTALHARRRFGFGQVVEVSHVEAMAALHQFTLLRHHLGGDILRRMGNRFTGQGQPNAIYPSADGWVCVSAPAADQVERLLAVTELDHLLDRPDISSPMDFQVLPHVLDDALSPWLAARTTDEIVELFQAVRIPATPVTDMAALLADPQLAEREYWRPSPAEAESGGPALVPGPPFRMSRHPWRGDAASGQPIDGSAGEWDQATQPPSTDGADDGPLAGLRVLDLTRVWAGPLATRTLAELGADVVWVEAPWGRGPLRLPDSMVESVKYFPNNDQGDCQWNRNGHLVKFALGKRSLALDLAADDGVPTFERLVPWADVVIENFSSRVMPQFGLDEDRLHELNPSLIYVTMPGYGRSGPAEHWLAFGSSVDSHAGLSSLIGYADQRPWKGGIAWPDPIAGLHATGALLIALWDRAVDAQQTESTGRGQTIEVAQFEATVAAVGDQLLAAQLPLGSGGMRLSGSSNRSMEFAPQGVYPCLGDDAWMAISVTTDEAWGSLVRAAGLGDPFSTLSTVAQRQVHHDEIDEALAEWTGEQDARLLAELLQQRGVAAAPVHNAEGLATDPHLEERGLFVTVDQPEFGPFTTAGIPIRLSATPACVRRRAPQLGEHSHEVLAEAGGLSSTEIDNLAARSVTADRPPA